MGVVFILLWFSPATIHLLKNPKWGAVALVFCFAMGMIAHQSSSVVIVQDFIQYCNTVDALRSDRTPLFLQRSVTALAPAGVLSSALGIIDSLIFLNTAALWAALMACHRLLLHWNKRQWILYPSIVMFPPIVLMGSMLDATPMMVMVLLWSSVFSIIGFDTGKTWLIGFGIALALLIDVRGALWVAPMILCWLISALKYRHIKSWFYPVIPIALSYFLAQEFIPERQVSLEEQLWWFYQERSGREHPIPFRKVFPLHEFFIWGHSSIFRWFDTMGWIWHVQLSNGPLILSSIFKGWLIVFGALVSTAIVLHKERLQNMVVLLSISPFAGLLISAMMFQPNWRRMAFGWVAVLVMWLYVWGGRRRFWLLSGLLILYIWTPWTIHVPSRQEPDIGALVATHPSPPNNISFRDPRCEAALRKDLEKGIPWGGRWYSTALQRRYVELKPE